MRIITISVLSIFACVPALANGRLPIVNVAAGSVSARAMFGEKPLPVTTVAPTEDFESDYISQPAVKKTVTARATTSPKKDSGKKTIAKAADVLSPRRPSNDLWAKIEKPLRLPEPQEFKTINNDFVALPEESLDLSSHMAMASGSARVTSRMTSESNMDSQIAKLIELQRVADNSVAPASVQKRPSTIASYDAPRMTTERQMYAASERVMDAPKKYNAADNDIAVRRVVVPMEQDVVVRPVNTEAAPSFARAANDDLAKMSPGELKKAFKKTYLSENKHLSTFQIDDRFDVASETSSAMEGFSSVRDLSEVGGVRPLEIKIGFRGDDSALSRDNYNLLSEYASIVVSNPKRAIQVSIPERLTRSADGRKLSARRLAIVEQVLRDTGVSDQRIMPVLAQRNDDSFILRVISSDQFETMTQKKRDMFGDTVNKKSYKSMTW